MISLLIKALTPDAAILAMKRRSITPISTTSQHDATTIRAYAQDKDWSEVMVWFGEPDTAPFQEGTLLHFNLEFTKPQPKRLFGMNFYADEHRGFIPPEYEDGCFVAFDGQSYYSYDPRRITITEFVNGSLIHTWRRED